MKKRQLFAGAAMLISAHSFGQIPTLTGANVNPAVNDSFVSIICDTTGVTPGPSGASQTWNFATTLHPTTLTYPIDTGYVMNASAASGYTFLSVFSTLFSTTTNIAIVTPASTITNFYAATPSKLTLTGIYSSSTANAVYSDGLDAFQYPFTYNSTFNDNYAGAITLGGLPATEAGVVTVNGDAYGTLVLPPTPPSASPTTYNGVLRVHSVQSFRDSAGIFGTTPANYTLETYTWYQPGYHSALLTISNTAGPFVNNKIVSYAQKQIANHQGVNELSGIETSLMVYPNPS